MPDIATFTIFLTAATLLAITPGAGIFYVMTRSLKGGKTEGIHSTLGTAIGGFLHVLAAAFGLSAILASSAVAFNVVKYLGAAYIIYLGLRSIFSKSALPHSDTAVVEQTSNRPNAFKQGVIVELFNPKTALFFLAFIPQFINPEGIVFLQFLLLGSITILLNSTADCIVVFLAGPLGHFLQTRPAFERLQRYFTGLSLIALGAYIALTDDNSH